MLRAICWFFHQEKIYELDQHYLKPILQRDPFTREEDIMELYQNILLALVKYLMFQCSSMFKGEFSPICNHLLGSPPSICYYFLGSLAPFPFLKYSRVLCLIRLRSALPASQENIKMCHLR